MKRIAAFLSLLLLSTALYSQSIYENAINVVKAIVKDSGKDYRAKLSPGKVYDSLYQLYTLPYTEGAVKSVLHLPSPARAGTAYVLTNYQYISMEGFVAAMAPEVQKWGSWEMRSKGRFTSWKRTDGLVITVCFSRDLNQVLVEIPSLYKPTATDKVPALPVPVKPKQWGNPYAAFMYPESVNATIRIGDKEYNKQTIATLSELMQALNSSNFHLIKEYAGDNRYRSHLPFRDYPYNAIVYEGPTGKDNYYVACSYFSSSEEAAIEYASLQNFLTNSFGKSPDAGATSTKARYTMITNRVMDDKRYGYDGFLEISQSKKDGFFVVEMKMITAVKAGNR